MQVFVPYPEPINCVNALDPVRRRKQLTELNQIIDAIEGKSEAWKNHPVTKMYAPYKEWLCRYRLCFKKWFDGAPAQAEWWSRHADMVRPKFLTEEFCDQHKRRLYTKNPELYPQFASYGTSEENWYFLDGEVVKYIKGKRVC